MKRFAHVVGTGASIPVRVLTNSDLEKMAETDDEWIIARKHLSKYARKPLAAGSPEVRQ